MALIPWGTLLSAAPTIARAAEALLTGARERRADAASTTALHELAARVAALEDHDLVTAELSKQLTDQLAALTTATSAVARRVRWLTMGVGAAVILSTIALIVVVTRA